MRDLNCLFTIRLLFNSEYTVTIISCLTYRYRIQWSIRIVNGYLVVFTDVPISERSSSTTSKSASHSGDYTSSTHPGKGLGVLQVYVAQIQIQAYVNIMTCHTITI